MVEEYRLINSSKALSHKSFPTSYIIEFVNDIEGGAGAIDFSEELTV